MSTQGSKIEAAGASRKPGIQLYSPQYYAACTLGGIIGTVPLSSLLLPASSSSIQSNN
jgi:hypothetical protein